MRIGLIGYGTGGRFFHAPFIEAADGTELVGVVTRSERRRAELHGDYPHIPVFDTPADLYAKGVDAVTITTPPETRRDLVLEALAAGVHVVADKPFAPDARAGRELADAAKSADRVLSVFHNRRWDTDIRTLAAVLGTGELGELWRIESRFELDQPDLLEGGPQGGLLRDLGAHLVDQAIWLLGPVQSVHADLDWVNRTGHDLDCRFAITLFHRSGVRSYLSSSKLNHMRVRELRAFGSHGGYWSNGTDVQAEAVFAGHRPVDNQASWGYEREDLWGTLSTDSEERRVPSAQGAYQDFYTRFAAAVRDNQPPPVTADEAIHVLEVLDAARLSGTDHRVILLRRSPPRGR
jgi:predicted dehydrogenase